MKLLLNYNQNILLLQIMILLENVNDPRVSKYAVITKDDDILSKKGRNYIIKMHGDIDDIEI